MARKEAPVYIETDRKSFLAARASLQRSDATIKELQQALAAQVAESAAQQARADAAEAALGAERDAHACTRDMYTASLEALTHTRKRVLQVLAGHNKLTAVMKTALSPEQYHEARAQAIALYPDLDWSE